MGAKSKVKGANGERELCRILAGSLSGSFVRVPNSGAAVGGKNVQRRGTLSKLQDRSFRGDIIPPDHLPRLVIESKAYASFRYHQLFKECPLLDRWLNQVKTSAEVDDFWILAFKSDRIPWFAIFDAALKDSFNLESYGIYTNKTGSYVITDLNEFVSQNNHLITSFGKNGIQRLQNNQQD